MSARHTAAVSITPMLLRLAIGLTVLWIGLGKIQTTIKVVGNDAALLANMGAMDMGTPPTPAPPKVVPATPTSSKGATGNEARVPRAASPSTLPSDATGGTEPPAERPSPLGSPPPAMSVVGGEGAAYTASDFGQPREVKRLYEIALRLHYAAEPMGAKSIRLWPKVLAEGRLPVIFAWLATIAEIGGGLFLIVGLFTRLSGLAVSGVMLGALWLMEIGPAVASGNTRLGFLDGARDLWDVVAWSRFFWLFLMMMGSFAIAFAGSGAFSFDRALFGAPKSGGDAEDEG